MRIILFALHSEIPYFYGLHRHCSIKAYIVYYAY